GLLADAEVEEAADLGLGVHLARPLLEAADEHHLAEDVAARAGVRKRVGAALPLFVARVLLCRGAPRGHGPRRVPGGPRAQEPRAGRPPAEGLRPFLAYRTHQGHLPAVNPRPHRGL